MGEREAARRRHHICCFENYVVHMKSTEDLSCISFKLTFHMIQRTIIIPLKPF